MSDYVNGLREGILNDDNNIEIWNEIYSEVSKAVWSTEFIDTLPDNAFAGIASGGEKDADGKTTPRTLRYLPHHNENVTDGSDNDTVDMAHLNSALSQVDDLDVTDALITKMKTHLEKHVTEIADMEDEGEDDE